MRRVDDIKKLRQNILDFIKEEVSSLPPQELNGFKIKFENVDYPPAYKNFEFSPREELEAILYNSSLLIPLKADVVLYDPSNKEVGRRRIIVAEVPYLRDKGTFILNGNNLTLANQLRLRPGVYSKIASTGDPVAMVNPSGGSNFQIILDNDSGIYYFKLRRGSFPLYPILKEIGIDEEEIKRAMGDLYIVNKEQTKRNIERFSRIIPAEGDTVKDKLLNLFNSSNLDPFVLKKTLNINANKVTKEVLLSTIVKLANIRSGVDPGDSKDDLIFQKIVTPAAFLAESIKFASFDYRKAVFKALMKRDLKYVKTKIFNKAIENSIRLQGLGQVLQDINPSERIDQIYRITRMGRGSIDSVEKATLEARSVQPTFAGFIDPLQTPEQEKIGLDVRLTRNVFVDDKEGILYKELINNHTKKKEFVSSRDLADYVIAFPGEMERKSNFVRVIKNGKLDIVKKDEVDYYFESFEDFFGPTSYYIPMQGASFPQRISMGSRMKLQALPLVNAESPNVMSGIENTPAESLFEDLRGIIRSPVNGKVTKITDDEIEVTDHSGKKHKFFKIKIEPNNNKTGFYHKTKFKVGDSVKKGDVLLYTNFSDSNGLDVYGINARVAYLPYYGLNYDDAVVISESFAKKLTSEHFYQEEVLKDKETIFSKSKYFAVFPDKIKNPEILRKYDENGIVRKGQIVNYGEPLVMAFIPPKKIRVKKGDRFMNTLAIDRGLFWEHQHPGEVVDIIEGKNFIKFIIRTQEEAQVGDKLTGRYGDKGVISAIIPDDKMLKDEEGNTIDIVFSPLGLPSRGNVSQIYEAILGKIAEKTGQKMVVGSWSEVPMKEKIKDLIKKYGIKTKERIYDPISGQYIDNVLRGNRYIMKLHITSESKIKGRNVGQYTLEQTPAKGGKESARLVGLLDINALVGHGAFENLMEMKLIKGQRQDNFWSRILFGLPPIVNEQSFVFEKFLNLLKGAGVNPVYKNEQINLFALTQEDIDNLSKGRVLTSASTVDWETENLEPIPGGLFDKSKTGGHGGRLWSKINLEEEIPSPITEKIFVTLLGINNNQFLDILSGKMEIPDRTGKYNLTNKTGIKGLKEFAEKFDIDAEIKETVKIIDDPNTPISKLNESIQKLKYLYFMKNANQKLTQFFWKSVPVVPPIFRPVAILPNSSIPVIEDANFLYNRIFEANRILKENKELLDDVSEEYINLYKSVASLVGTYDPIGKFEKNKEIVGILKFLFGKRGKIGYFQRKVLGTTIDYSGQAVIIPNPNLSIDEAGIPEELAWRMFKMFILNNLKNEKGFQSLKEAINEYENRTDIAKQALLEEMDKNFVIMKRDPLLHKYGMFAFKPVLVPGNVIQINPALTPPLGADFDGDTMGLHITLTDKSRKEAVEKMLPSKNLISPQEYKPLFVPGKEYLYGIWEISNKDENNNIVKNKVRSVGELKNLLNEGKLKVKDLVELQA